MARGLGNTEAYSANTAPAAPGSSATIGDPWGTNSDGKMAW
jgi:hypothetical protein